MSAGDESVQYGPGQTLRISGTIVTFAIVVLIFLAFLLLVFALYQQRRVVLDGRIKDVQKWRGLRCGPEDLGRMYNQVREAWDRRAGLVIHPESSRLPAGFMEEDGVVINVRSMIAHSIHDVLEEAEVILGERPAYESARRYLGRIPGVASVLGPYLEFYERARFFGLYQKVAEEGRGEGAWRPEPVFANEDYHRFKIARDALLEWLHGQAGN